MEQQHNQSLQDQAYNALRSKIIYAELKPGTRLSAIGLEKETGIGRTPIRESFVRLREQELVETRPKSGTYVSKISMERAENACFLREKLERSVLIKCCSAASPEQKHRLEQILAESESLDHSETRRFFDLDNLFHETCFEIAGRHMLWDWMKSVNTHFERYNWLRMVSQDLDWEPIRRQHRRILEAIKRGDTDAASYLAETHLHLMPEEQGPVIALHPDYFELSKDSAIKSPPIYVAVKSVLFGALGGINSPYFTATALGRNRGTKLRHRLEEKTGSKSPFLQTAPQLFWWLGFCRSGSVERGCQPSRQSGSGACRFRHVLSAYKTFSVLVRDGNGALPSRFKRKGARSRARPLSR